MNDFAKLHTFESTRECRSQGNRFVHLKHSKFHNRSVTSIDFLFILKNYLDHVRHIARKTVNEIFINFATLARVIQLASSNRNLKHSRELQSNKPVA